MAKRLGVLLDLRQQQREACGEHNATLQHLHALSRIVWFGNLRRHGIFFLAYVVLVGMSMFALIFALPFIDAEAIAREWFGRRSSP